MKKFLALALLFSMPLQAFSWRWDCGQRTIFRTPRFNYKMVIGLTNNKKFIFYYRNKKEAYTIYHDLIHCFDAKKNKTLVYESSSITFFYDRIAYVDFIAL